MIVYGPHSHDHALRLQQDLIAAVIILASSIVVAFALRAILILREFNDASLSLIPFEAVLGHSFNVSFILKPKKRFRATDIRIGLLYKERHWAQGSHNAAGYVYFKSIFEQLVTTGQNFVFEPHIECEIEQEIVLPKSVDHERPAYDLDWYALVLVRIPWAPDYRAEFPIHVHQDR